MHRLDTHKYWRFVTADTLDVPSFGIRHILLLWRDMGCHFPSLRRSMASMNLMLHSIIKTMIYNSLMPLSLSLSCTN